jgi:hypothetical protein
MTCGDIHWWRAPDLLGLLERHGQAEHLVVQFDFITQVQRLGRAEYSIPGASKKKDGSTGYADILSLASSEIWEIKPDTLEPKAVEEANWYVSNAIKSCSPTWRIGTSYTAANRYGKQGVVFRIEGNGNKAELFAKQGQPGAILYYWEINGKRDTVAQAAFGWALRQAIVSDYFAVGGTLQPLEGAKAPNNLPPGRFKPPVLKPSGCIPELGKFVDKLQHAIQTTSQPVIFDNAAVAILMEEAVYNAMVGPRIVAQQMGLMQVKQDDPTVKLYRETLAIITAAGLTHAAVASVIAVGALIVLAIMAGAELVGGVLVVALEAVKAAAAPILATGGVMGTFSTGVAASAPTALAVGAGLVVFAIPRASKADPSKVVSVDVSLPKYVVLKPSEVANVRVGQSVTVNGATWYVAGIATTQPG